jgi:hypothetical protein
MTPLRIPAGILQATPENPDRDGWWVRPAGGGRLSKEKLRQGNAHLPSAAELLCLTRKIGLPEPQSGQHLFYPRLHPESVGCFEAVLEFAVDIEELAEGFGVVWLGGHRLLHLRKLLLVARILKHRFGFCVERAPGRAVPSWEIPR